MRAVRFAVATALLGCTLVGCNTTTAPKFQTDPTPDPAGTAALLATGKWTALPPAPIVGRNYAATAWTGSQMLVWGGTVDNNTNLADGAAYDPSTKTWTKMAPSGLSGRIEMASAWTGTQLFVWGGLTDSPGTTINMADDGALYTPATNSWQRIATAPLKARADAQALWINGKVYVIGGTHYPITSSDDGHFLDGAAYDPSKNSWTEISSMPKETHGQIEDLQLLDVGNTVLGWRTWDHLVTKKVTTGTETSGTDGVDLLSYDALKNQWTSKAAPPTTPPIRDPLLAGDSVIAPAASGCPAFASCAFPMNLKGSRLDLATHTWTPIPHGPVDDLNPVSLWTGSALVRFDVYGFIGGSPGHPAVNPGDAAVWDPRTNKWTSLPPTTYVSDGVSAVWTGSHILEWGAMEQAHPPGDIKPLPHSVGFSFGAT